jgi:uracil-DNA glycosylase family 4
MLQRPVECRDCALDHLATGFSRPDGLGTLGVDMVGEALGEAEARDGLPFRNYAQAGSLLERVIRMCGFDRQQFRIWNIIQCRPPRDFLANAPWELGAVNHCAVHRDRIVQEARPKTILALGSIPLQYLTGHAGKSRGVTYLRGYVMPSLDWGGIPTIASFHPSFIQRGKKSFINVLAHDLRKAVAIAQGKFTDYCLNPDLDASNFVSYITKPSPDDARSYLQRAKDNQGAFMAFDIETGNSMFVDEDADDEVEMEVTAGQITQIQFSLGVGEAIAMPWVEPFRSIAIEMLGLPHIKAAHNGWRFDLPVLKREHVEVKGIVHDTRWMWHHLQPDLPAHLQFVGSFYGMPFPWKHLASYDETFYGCADADVLSRIMATLPQQMESKGIWSGYARQVKGLEPCLINLTRRGIPVDNEIRNEFGKRLQKEKEVVKAALQPLWPPELVRLHPPKGYVRPPKDKTGLVRRDFTALLADKNQGNLLGEQQPIIRWCEEIPFNPGSRDQILDYLEFRGIPAPSKHKIGGDTVQEVELLKLIGRLKREPKKRGREPDIKLLEGRLEYVELDKMHGTYVEGWVPDDRGFVHPIFNYGTAVGQLASKAPNGQNFPKRSKLAKEMRRMIAAKPGHKIIEIDKSSFHAVTLAFEAQSPNWMRLARSDIHSFTTAHFLKLPERDQLLGWPDDQLRDYLAWVKKTHKTTRDNKAKHAILGVGNGLGYRKLYNQYSDYFDGQGEAKTLLDTIRGVFPEVFIYQNRRRREAHDATYLISKWGYIRWFFDVMHYDSKAQDMVPGDDSEAALCFHHVNDAFGMMREDMLWMFAQGYDERFGFCNTIHDSFIFHCPDALVDECLYVFHDQMTKRSPVLVEPVTSPTGLWVDVDCSVGQDWASLQSVNMGKPAGLKPGPEGLAVLAPVSETFEPLPAPGEMVKVYANVPDDDIPF